LSFFARRLRRPAVLLILPAFLAACMGPPKPRFSASDTDDIARVTAYLNATPRFEAHFSQTGSYGPGAGLVWVDRPGRLRLDYEGAASRVMVINGGRVRVLDRGTGALTTMPLSRTPLGILLAQDITLSGPVTVTSVQHGAYGLQMTLQKTDAPAQGSLTLYFSDQPLQLNAVTVTDSYQRSLTLSLSPIDRSPAITPDLFAPPAPAASGPGGGGT
jgi:outer membrane lipoprotein-sorting protein